MRVPIAVSPVLSLSCVYHLTAIDLDGSGNWDVKTKIPEQCRDSGIELKPYFNEWINLKDIYYNFYKKRVQSLAISEASVISFHSCH